MEQEKNREAETAPESSTKPGSSTKPESNIKEQENKNKSGTSTEASMKPDSIKKEAEAPAEAYTGPESSRKKAPNSLKAKSKITKKSLGSNFLNSRKDKGDRQARWRQRKKNKRVLKGNIESSNNGEDLRLKSREEGKGKNSIDEEHKNKSNQPKRNQKPIIELGQHKQRKRNGGEHGLADSIITSQKNKETLDGPIKGQHDEKKEKIGGMIFMCNAKTKPDCFRYRVMGVTTSKKDVVMGVKPGLKIFLYDFDLKLLYGIYTASSSGGMRLEPRAFGGAFPVQVRFSIEKDCLPLPESVFKQAIKENYDGKNKFKTELTVKQARKLKELFRPAEVHSTAPPVSTPLVAKEVWPHAHKVALASDPYTHGDSSSYHFLPHERDHQHIAYRGVTTLPRVEIPREFYPTEKEYQAHGLHGDRRNLIPPPHVTPTFETYQMDHERVHLRQPDHMETVPAQRETVRADPLYMNEKEYQAYGLGARREMPTSVPVATVTSATALGFYKEDPYNAYRYGTSSVEPYLPPLRREEAPSGSYSIGGMHPLETAHLRRTENDRVGSLYSAYDAAAALQHNNQTQHYQAAQPEAAPGPVSSRYSFAGLSYSYR
ncbi:hypothetical protein F2P56_023647 [Juglans regia]|uniref:Uncharacterized protein LOC109011050 n=2 Tax=Juglans regia TaxID=51240 RepID=A0A2I4GUN6_JUGRE|nr:uncharacterized protein LOC109011050 [Juglans regia]XP_018847615.2 uncharacterized protein LOC109011050 [Juglans regia]XP_018847616.2 uncharacterized protein LOC109011050 [Juglans regia]XP_018847617.2 uncharacterized protein LOC109011050 [Juglans regia]KAF5453938.1 hypothetical protein F2P56_023647 [Juglans regia]